jgi:hypothetical protein
MVNTLGALLVSIAWLEFSCSAADQDENPPDSSLARTFDEIYRRGHWGTGPNGKGTSGSGSTLVRTVEYRRFLENFIRENNIASIVDGGCGDWEFSRQVDWGDATYLGLDISQTAIATAKQHATERIQFRIGDVTEMMPRADLLIVKDVLQHLPNGLIEKFIENNLRPDRYKWVILTNDRWPTMEECVTPGSVLCGLARRGLANNEDIQAGAYRTLDLRKAPFNVTGLEDVMRFQAEPIKVVQIWMGGAK